MSEWIGTFGLGGPRGDRFVRIEAAGEPQAREVMVRHYREEWAFVYPSEDAAGVDRFGLIEIALGR